MERRIEQLARRGTLAKLESDLMRARLWAEKNYRKWRNVIGVGAGTKYTAGRRTNDSHAIQFYVKRKTVTGKTLPKFVYGRYTNGRVDRSKRFYTDVIETGPIVSACGSGSDIRRTGKSGAITLLFQNKTPGDRDYYLITCAHVAGDLNNQSHPFRDLTSDCFPNANPFAVRLYHSTHENKRVRYDIALAKLDPTALPQVELQVTVGVSSPVTLTGFLPRGSIRPNLRVQCAFPVSRPPDGIVDSYAGTVQVQVGGNLFDIENAYLLKLNVRPGDSGGLIYKDSVCVGMLFARAPSGWAWFHPLETAVTYLGNDSGIKIYPF